MKKVSLFGLLKLISAFTCTGFSQLSQNFLFDSSWYGFTSSPYSNGQSLSQVKSKDFDNDGSSYIVREQENFSNGFILLAKNLSD